jgi:hypothetical protein
MDPNITIESIIYNVVSFKGWKNNYLLEQGDTIRYTSALPVNDWIIVRNGNFYSIKSLKTQRNLTV